jgi:hypothetical protein
LELKNRRSCLGESESWGTPVDVQLVGVSHVLSRVCHVLTDKNENRRLRKYQHSAANIPFASGSAPYQSRSKLLFWKSFKVSAGEKHELIGHPTPRSLLGVIKLGGATCLFPEHVIDVSEGLFKHIGVKLSSKVRQLLRVSPSLFLRSIFPRRAAMCDSIVRPQQPNGNDHAHFRGSDRERLLARCDEGRATYRCLA